MIPKAYLDFEIYNNLIQNDDEVVPHYQQVPRTGAFEVSYKGMLVFSKLNGGYWPNCELVAEKCEAVVRDEAQGKDCTQYLAGNTPLRGGGFVQSSAKKLGGGLRSSPQRNSTMKKSAQVTQQQQQEESGFGGSFSQEQYPDENLRVQAQEYQPEEDKSEFRQIDRQPMEIKKEKFKPEEVPVEAGPHLRSPHDITGMVHFPAGTKSLLSKYLTPEVYNAYRNK